MLPLLCLLPLALAQCSLVSVSGCQPITTPPLPSDPRAHSNGDGVLSVVTSYPSY